MKKGDFPVKIQGISPDMLQRYVKARNKIDTEARVISSHTHLLGLFQEFNAPSITINPEALGHINHIMNQNILNIWEVLDDFLPLTEAKRMLEVKSKI